jgi:hypothetical protein
MAVAVGSGVATGVLRFPQPANPPTEMASMTKTTIQTSRLCRDMFFWNAGINASFTRLHE